MDADFLLLDRVFQPAADRMAGLADCFGLARTLLAGAVALQTAVLCCDFSTFTDPLHVAFAITAALLAYVGADAAAKMIGRAARQSRRGAMNVHRITLRYHRLAWLLCLPAVTATLLPIGGVRATLEIAAALCWVATVYFASCTPTPPPMRAGRSLLAFG